MLPVRTDEINVVGQVSMTTCKYIICVHFSICTNEMENIKISEQKKDKIYVEVKHRKNLNVYIL